MKANLIKAGAKELTSDRFVKLILPNGYFYQVCCDCGLAHRFHISGQDEITMMVERLDEGVPLEEIDGSLVVEADLTLSEIFEITWINHDFMEMSQKFRDMRAKHTNKGDKCWWCGHSFEDGEMMALVGVAKKLNQLVCQSCASALAEIGGSDE
jgi:hypothetical protein